MRRTWVILGLVLAVTTACGTPRPGSTPEVEGTKLDDVVSSSIARTVLDPRNGPVKRLPVITDNAASVSTSLMQPTTDGPGREQGLIDVVKRAKRAGARFYDANCVLTRRISVDGSADIRSSYPGIATWPARVSISEGPVMTYAPPTYTTGKTLEIRVEISVGGGTQLQSRHGSRAPGPATCPKAIVALLE
jgi:hypothetical protein